MVNNVGISKINLFIKNLKTRLNGKQCKEFHLTNGYDFV